MNVLLLSVSSCQRSGGDCFFDFGPREAVSLLSPSGGPTQAGTTPRVAFRAMIGADDELYVSVEL